MEQFDLPGMARDIRQLRQLAEELDGKASGMEAVHRNVQRILANIKILEINVCDVEEVDSYKK